MKAFDKWLSKLRDTGFYDTWSKNDITYFRKAIGPSGLNSEELRAILVDEFNYIIEKTDQGIPLTAEHSEFGRQYLLDNTLRKNGTFRKRAALGQREVDILNDFDCHYWAGLYDTGNGYYWPIYRAVGNSGDWFDYLGVTYESMKVIG